MENRVTPLVQEVLTAYRNLSLSMFEQTEGLLKVHPMSDMLLPLAEKQKEMSLKLFDSYETTVLGWTKKLKV